MNTRLYDVIILGAGAAGLMAAVEAGARGKHVLLIDHSQTIGEKIRISGGGRCNFTNLHAAPQNYISENPHFMKSALASYTQHDFIALVESFKIAYHEKTLGQLFCDGSSKQIIDMFRTLCDQNGVEIRLGCTVSDVSKSDKFSVVTDQGSFLSQSLIIATGGLSIPKMGATDFGYRLAKQFDLKIVPPRPALVPLLAHESIKEKCTALSGVSNASIVSYGKRSFKENILFTHRGLSGPAILQISSYINDFKGSEVLINLLPNMDLKKEFAAQKQSKQSLSTFLKLYLTNRFVDHLDLGEAGYKSLTDLKLDYLNKLATYLHAYPVLIDGSEGYAKAEVTVGGVSTEELSSKTMAVHKVPHLYFIGEVVDVTGWLGGYNFQWAWSSGFLAGRNCA